MMIRLCVPLCSVLLLTASVFAADWEQWRGPDHNGVSRETGLLTKWADGGPQLLWRTNILGAGYSNLSFHGGKIFTMGDRGDSCFLFALDEKTGKELWSLNVGKAGGNYEGPRCTPATDGKRIFALGQFGNLVCADAQTGKEIWRINVESELGGRVMSGWNFSMSPIIDGEQVVLPIGGKDGTVIALKKDSAKAELIWRSTELTDAAAYSSVVPMTFGSVRQYLAFTDKRIAGLDAVTGKVLWQHDQEGKVAVCSDPAFLLEGDTCYLITSCAYRVGAGGFKITAKDKKFTAEKIYQNNRFENHHGGIVRVGKYFYFVTNRDLVCVDPKSGEQLWSNRCVGKGSVMSVDGKLVVRSESDGAVALVDASPEGYKEFSRFVQPDRSNKNSWTYPTVYDGKLYLRDQGLLLCYTVK